MTHRKNVLLLVSVAVLMLLVVVPSFVSAAAFVNPLPGTTDFKGFLVRITNWLLSLVGFFAMLALVYGGIHMITAFGDDKRVSDGKKIIFWAIVGLLVVGISYAIVTTVSGFLGV